MFDPGSWSDSDADTVSGDDASGDDASVADAWVAFDPERDDPEFGGEGYELAGYDPADGEVGEYLVGVSAAEVLAFAVAHPDRPGSVSLGDLESVDPRELCPDDAVTFLLQVERVKAYVAGLTVHVRRAVTDVLVADEEARDARDAQAHRQRNAERVAAGLVPTWDGGTFVAPEQAACAELAAVLRVTPRVMASMYADDRDFTGPWRPLLDALVRGDVSEAHARAIGRELVHAPGYGDPEQVVTYERGCRKALAVLIPYAATHTVRQTREHAARLVAVADPAGSRRRRREAAEEQHGVFATPTEPGTCQLTAIMPVAHGYAVLDAVNTLAKDDRFETADGCITPGQRRVAALVALTLGDPGSVAVVDSPVSEVKLRASVNVVAPLATLTGFATRGGTIGAQTVTSDVLIDVLATCDPSSTLRRLVTDQDGVVLDAGRTKYQISDAQRRVITLRDRYCRFPGCPHPAERCEIDVLWSMCPPF